MTSRMNASSDRLYELLPAVYRMRDAEQGYPLRALLRVIAEQVERRRGRHRPALRQLVHRDLRGLGGALHRRPGRLSSRCSRRPAARRDAAGRARTAILVPRREVANTIRYRRRKGTLGAARGAGARRRRLAGAGASSSTGCSRVNQNINHLHLHRGRTVDLRDGDALDRLDGAVRRDRPHRRRAAHQFRASARPLQHPERRRLRLAPARLPVTRTPAYCYEENRPELLHLQRARQRRAAVRRSRSPSRRRRLSPRARPAHADPPPRLRRARDPGTARVGRARTTTATGRA